jgi:hypothetical protein
MDKPEAYPTEHQQQQAATQEEGGAGFRNGVLDHGIVAEGGYEAL